MNVDLRNMPRFLREHRWTRSHLSEYLDGQLTPAQTHRVEDHVTRCPKCHELLDALKRTIGGLRDLRSSPPAGLADGVIGRLRRER